MLKLLLTGVWVCAVTLGAVWFSISRATAPTDQADAAPKVETELMKGEAITIPLIADGAVKGYFLTRVSFIVDKVKIKDAKMPMTELMTDELFTLLVGSPVVDIAAVERFDLAAFKAKIKSDLNARYGAEMISDVLVEQIDYLSKEDIRVNSQSKTPTRRGVQITPGETLPDKPAGH